MPSHAFGNIEVLAQIPFEHQYFIYGICRASVLFFLSHKNHNNRAEYFRWSFLFLYPTNLVTVVNVFPRAVCPTLRGPREGSGSVGVQRIEDAAQTRLRLLQATDACTTEGCAPVVVLFLTQKIMMDGNVCNIQVLLRAAEFLERRERGKMCMTTVSVQGEEVGYCLNSKMHNEATATMHVKRNTETQCSAVVRETIKFFCYKVILRRSFPFDSVTYISVASLYSKAPIWSSLKMNPSGADRSFR